MSKTIEFLDFGEIFRSAERPNKSNTLSIVESQTDHQIRTF